MSKDYVIKDGVLRFNDYVTRVPLSMKIPSSIIDIDFNNVMILPTPFDLSHTKVTHVNFGNVILGEIVILPQGCSLDEKFYNVKGFFERMPNGTLKRIPAHRILTSERMKYLRQQDAHSHLIYLSGTVRGKLELREQQREHMMNHNDLLGVYSPGNHITFGDPAIEKISNLVYLIDKIMLDNADIFFFDLNDLSLTPGTMAELGYVVGTGKAGRAFYMMNEPTENFFINGLLSEMVKVDSIEEFLEEVTYRVSQAYN